MKILISGGNGLIGSNLLTGLPKHHEIISLSRGTKYSQLSRIIGSNVKLVKGNVSDGNLKGDLFNSTDAILHFAGGGGNSACMSNPSSSVDTYINGTRLLLRKAKEFNIDLFVFASSHFSYSTYKKKNLPLKEDDELEPDDLYGSLKAAAEKIIVESGVNYIILRFSNIFGFGNGLHADDTGGAIENFLSSVRSKKDISVYGTGKQKLAYLNVKDVVQCINLILESRKRNEIYNVGGSEIFTVEEIANIVSIAGQENYSFKTNIKKIEVPEEKVWPDKIMSNDKIRKDLGWHPEMTLKEGIKEYMINDNSKC